MTGPDRLRLAARLRSFDEAGLVALANRGLLRRATKDLEALELRVEETAGALLVHGPGWTVTMPPEGPTGASDTTRATGVTRQILAATLWLRDRWAAEVAEGREPRDAGPAPAAAGPGGRPAATAGREPATTPGSEVAVVAGAGGGAAPGPASPAADGDGDGVRLRDLLAAVEPSVLERWAGARHLDAAERLLRAAPEHRIETGAGLVVRFPDHDVEVRLMPGDLGRAVAAPLAACLSTAARRVHRTWVAAAVLVLRAEAGRPPAPQSRTAPAAPAGSVLTRDEVLREASRLLHGLVAAGLAHPSRTWTVRLATLAPSATAVHLPRLDRSLTALADEVELILGRRARADSARLLGRLAETGALVRALTVAGDAIPLALAGRHRARYEATADLELAGLGAWPWRTATGWEGLTVLFWDLGAERLRSWSWTRPADRSGPSPADAFRSASVWPGAPAPETLCRSHVRLTGARVSPEDRLSGSASTTAEPGPATAPRTLEAALRRTGRLVDDWRALRRRAGGLLPGGLVGPEPLDDLVCAAPTGWGEARFDELGQRFLRPITDGAGRDLELTLPWSEVHESSIDFLERISPERERVWAVLGRLVVEGGVRLEPLALLCEPTEGAGPGRPQVLCPAWDGKLLERPTSALLERLRRKFGRDRIATTMEARDAEADGLEGQGPAAIAAPLARAADLLLELAEGGCRRAGSAWSGRLRREVAALERRGLATFAERLARLAEAPGAPERLLDAAWVGRLHRRALRRLSLGGSGSAAL